MFLTVAVLSLGLLQDPVPMRMTGEELLALEACVGNSRDPMGCGIAEDVVQVTACMEALPVPTAATANAWLVHRAACLEALPCHLWTPAADQDDAIRLMRACSVREWGVLKSVSARWLERLAALYPPEAFDEVARFETLSTQRMTEREAAALQDTSSDTASRAGVVAGIRIGGWDTVLFTYQVALFAAEGRVDAETASVLAEGWVNSP
jgi:hypothetical protein